VQSTCFGEKLLWPLIVSGRHTSNPTLSGNRPLLIDPFDRRGPIRAVGQELLSI
jgi:hypothetical protein